MTERIRQLIGANGGIVAPAPIRRERAPRRPVTGLSRSWLRACARRAWILQNQCQPSCVHCGRPADIHHDDGNPQNNAPENLIPLCRSHHIALENSRHPKRVTGTSAPAGAL